MAQELPGPAVDLAFRIEVLPLDRAQQIRHFVGAVSKRVSLRILLDLEVEGISRRVVEANDTLDAQLLRSAGESGDRNTITEDVVHPADISRFRGNDELGIEQFLVVAVARPQHHAVLAERDRLLVAVDGDVANGDDLHRLCLLWVCRLRLRGLGRIAEEGGREVAGDGVQLLLHQVEELVETLAEDRRYVERSQDRAQAVELFGGIVAVAQQIARLEFAEQPVGLTYTMMDRAGEGLVEQQETRHPRRCRAGCVQAAIGVVAGRRTQQRVPLADIGWRADIGGARQQQVIFDVEQPCRLVGALDVASELVEIPTLIAEKGALGDPGMSLAGLLYRTE